MAPEGKFAPSEGEQVRGRDFKGKMYGNFWHGAFQGMVCLRKVAAEKVILPGIGNMIDEPSHVVGVSDVPD